MPTSAEASPTWNAPCTMRRPNRVPAAYAASTCSGLLSPEVRAEIEHVGFGHRTLKLGDQAHAQLGGGPDLRFNKHG